MIVVAGGTGLLGSDVVGRLTGRGVRVRILTRDPDRARRAGEPPAEVELVRADVRDSQSLDDALTGATTVLAAVQGFGGTDAGGIEPVDRDGNIRLIRAATRAGARHLVLMSIHGASPTSPLALARAKAAAEAELATTALRGTVIRPTAYMETWAGFVGGPILATGRARIFGHGRNPMNFVAARDVAAIVEQAILDPDGQPASIDVVGPQDVSLVDLVEMFARAIGRDVPRSHVPPAMLRVLSVLARPVRPVLAQQIEASLVLDRAEMRAVGRGTVTGSTVFDEVVGAMVASAGGAVPSVT
ncbi:MAG TPA: NAD(P)H-binding protein [Candidatus Limnocylindrales bacterium]|nr:NAD(P)H-binding protein [Candidatus Limnocylindrales bacterium]